MPATAAAVQKPARKLWPENFAASAVANASLSPLASRWARTRDLMMRATLGRHWLETSAIAPRREQSPHALILPPGAIRARTTFVVTGPVVDGDRDPSANH